jgi:hypothetical protein
LRWRNVNNASDGDFKWVSAGWLICVNVEAAVLAKNLSAVFGLRP